MTEVFEFDVAVSTHDLLRQGILTKIMLNVQVQAESHTEAFMIAYAMGACHGVVTDIWDRI